MKDYGEVLEQWETSCQSLPGNEMNFNILLGLIEFFFWGLGGGSRAGFVKNMKL